MEFSSSRPKEHIHALVGGRGSLNFNNIMETNGLISGRVKSH